MTPLGQEKLGRKRLTAEKSELGTFANQSSPKNQLGSLAEYPNESKLVSDTDLTWVFEALSYDPAEDPAQASVINYIQRITELVVSDAYKSIDFLLRSMDPDQLPLVTIVTFVRTTYPVRSKLPEWKAFRDSCATSIRKRNRDSVVLLRGV